MGNMTEAKVKVWAKARLQKELPGVWLYAPPGGMFGKAGVPDQLGLWKGVFFAIEYKATENLQPSAVQMVQLEHLDREGAIACVLRGKNSSRLDSLIAIIKARAS